MDRNNIQSLIDEFADSYLNIFQELDIYYWVGSGAIRDLFAESNPRDIDFFFSDQQSRKKAVQLILTLGAKKVQNTPRGEKFEYNDTEYDLLCWDGSGDPPCTAKTPEEMITWFDYTVEMAAVDSNGKFHCYPTFYDDVVNRRLIRNPTRRLQDLYPRPNNRRLLKYIKKGYAIDMNNLLLFLEDQEATFDYRWTKKQEKARKHTSNK